MTFQLLSSLVKLRPKREKQMRHTGVPVPASALMTFTITLHWLHLAGMCSLNSQRCLHKEEVKLPEATKLKWQVRMILKKELVKSTEGRPSLWKGWPQLPYCVTTGKKQRQTQASIPIVLPAGLTLIHRLDKAGLTCKGCLTREESNGLLKKNILDQYW